MLEVRLIQRFDGFDLDIGFQAPAGVTALFGRSGAGKTTIVNAVAGLTRPQGGRIVLDGQVLFDAGAGICVPPHRRQIGYVFQDARLFPHLDVRQNLLYGRRFAPARDDAPGIAHQHFEQAEFARLQIDLLAVANDSAANQIHLQIGDGKLRLLALQGRTAGKSIDARQQFRERKRFGQIVVATGFQALHAVVDRAK